MSKKFITALLERRPLVIIIIILTIVGGIGSYMAIPKQHFPPVNIPMATVTAVYPGATSEDMEVLVCEKIEDKVAGIDTFDYCNSTIMDNVCVVTVMLDLDASMDRIDAAYIDLRNKMDDLKPSLPSGVVSLSVNTELLDVAEVLVAISGEDISEDELTERTEGLKDALKAVEGVNSVSMTKPIREALDKYRAIVRRIAENPIYIGTLIQGKTTTPNYKLKDKRVTKDESEWTVIEKHHEAIIDKNDFELVQKLLKLDLRTSPNEETLYPFAGILFCADCGAPMTRKKFAESVLQCGYIQKSESVFKNAAKTRRICGFDRTLRIYKRP